MEKAIRGKTVIRHKHTGITGTFISQWFNVWSGQMVVNVRVGRMTLSWVAATAEVA